jgi:hypothetical protein
MNTMTKIILSAVMVFTMTIANAQSKKEQIENLTFSLDSLNQVVSGERQNFNTTLDSLNQLLSKNQQDFELEMDKSSITIKNLNSQLIRLNSINDSLSNGITRRQIRIDSISLALDSIILVANELDRKYENVFARIDFFSTGESINASYINEKGLTIGEYRFQVMAGQDEIYGWLKIAKAESVSDWEGMWIGGPSRYVDIAGFFNEDYVHQVKFVKWVSSTSFIVDIHVYPNYRRVKIDIRDMDNLKISEIR